MCLNFFDLTVHSLFSVEGSPAAFSPRLKRPTFKSQILEQGSPAAEAQNGLPKVKDWKEAYSKSIKEINEQRKAISKLSKLCLGALSAVDRLESQVISQKQGHEDHQLLKRGLESLQSEFVAFKGSPSSSKANNFDLESMVERIKDEMSEYSDWTHVPSGGQIVH